MQHVSKGERTESAAFKHVVDATRRADYHLHARRQFLEIVAHGSAANKRVTRHIHLFAQRRYDCRYLLRQLARWRHDDSLWRAHIFVDHLQYRNAERCRFASARLRLCDHIPACVRGEVRSIIQQASLRSPLQHGSMARC